MLQAFHYPLSYWLSQIAVGLVNGGLYAILSLGLAVIFGMLNIINFAHGALFMVGAFTTWMLNDYFGVGYFYCLIVVPLLVGALGLVMEKTLISRVYKLDHLYGLLLTFGIALIIEGLYSNKFGSSGVSYQRPELLAGVKQLGFMAMPTVRLWSVSVAFVVCIATWALIEKTS